MYLCAQITSPLQHPPSLGNSVLFFGHKKQRFMRMTTIIARIAKILGQQYLKFNILLLSFGKSFGAYKRFMIFTAPVLSFVLTIMGK